MLARALGLRAACKVHEPSLSATKLPVLGISRRIYLSFTNMWRAMLCKRAPQRGARCHVYGASIGLYHQRGLNPAERGGYGNIGHAF